jgi:uncharacterized membrane protein
VVIRSQKIKQILDILFVVALTIFALFIIYQILRKVFGGSWATEGLVIALLVLNITLTFHLTKEVTQIKTDLSHIKMEFRSLAHDFKEHIKHR